MPARAGRRPTLALALALAASAGLQARGDAGVSPPEYQIKAAFVYGVMKFVTWPAASLTGPVTVAVLGPAAAQDMTRVLGAKQLGGQPIVVRTFARARDLGPAHVLFVAADAAPEAREALRAVGGAAVLTIVETPGAAPAVITLDVVATRLVFDVDLDVSRIQGLQLSSNLLALARRVQNVQRRREPTS